MAAATQPMNSTDVIISISEDSGTSYDTVGYCTNCNLQWSMDIRDVTTKSAGGRRAIRPGKSQWQFNLDGLVTYNAQTDIDKPNDLYTIADAKTSIQMKIGSTNTGEYDYEGAGYITSYSQDAGVEDNNTFSCAFDGDGALTQAAVA